MVWEKLGARNRGGQARLPAWLDGCHVDYPEWIRTRYTSSRYPALRAPPLPSSTAAVHLDERLRKGGLSGQGCRRTRR